MLASAYGNVFRNEDIVIQPGEDVIFDQSGVLNGITHSAPSPFVQVLKSGDYLIDFELLVVLNPQFIDNRAAAFAITIGDGVNQVIHPNTRFGQQTVAQPNIVSESYTFNLVGTSIVTISEGSFVTLRNIGSTQKVLQDNSDGAAVKAASLRLVNLNECTLTTTSFSNDSPIVIPDGPANPYPSTINVSGLTGSIVKVTVTLHNLTHPFLNDLEILLVGPNGENAILMSDVGNGFPGATDSTYTFDDDATDQMVSFAVPPSGTYRPSNDGSIETIPPPAPQQPPPYGTALHVFNGTNPNGTWQLFIHDDDFFDEGVLAGGWELHITTCER